MRCSRRCSRRSGNVLVITAAMMVAVFGMLAFAVDLGYLQVVRSQMQRSADAAAIAAAWDLIDQNALSGHGDPTAVATRASATARQYTQVNTVGGVASSLAQSDITLGYLANPSDRNTQMSFSDPSRFNAVQIRVRRTADQNGEVPLYFAKVLGMNTCAGQAQATAAFVNNFCGFTTPSDGSNLEILPLTLDKTTWDSLTSNGTDEWTFDPATGQVRPGPDGIKEVNLYPQGTGAPGNRGTVDIGNPNNSTADLARQLLHGISPADLAYHGGRLALNEQGELSLNGDPGISAGVKDELASIKGKPQIVPVFSHVTGNGNNAQYTVVQFVGVRIMDVKLTGSMSSKRVIVQPACVMSRGAIPATGDAQTSRFIYSSVWLVR